MKLETVEFNGKSYPAFQAEGYAMQFIAPFARKICKGVGVDVGCHKHEWMFEGQIHANYPLTDYDSWLELVKMVSPTSASFPIDPVINGYDAMYFPSNCINLDYIISSHCLEHLYNWVEVLDYWTSRLAPDGILFLYLPDYSQEYWRPWNNRKHKNIFTPQILEDYLNQKGYINIYKTGVDLNNSFAIFGQKNGQ